MRVLFVTASYPPDSVGGVELHVAGLARRLIEAGHEPCVFARAGRPGVAHLATVDELVDDVPVTRLGNTFEDATRLELIYDHPAIADAFARHLARVRPDVVHIHHLTCLSTAIVGRCRQAGVPVLMTLHDFWMGCPRGQRITAALDVCPTIRLDKCVPCLRELWPHLLGGQDLPAGERDARDRAALETYHAAMRHVLGELDALVTPSAFMKRMYVDYGVPAEAITVVENGLDRRPWRGRRPAAPPAGGPVRVGFIGSVLPSKGVHLLLEAAVRLGDPGALRVDVWGEVLPFHNDRSYGARLAALRAGHESSIALHGAYRNEQLPEILGRLDILVVPSIWYEAFGLTIREAFLAGVPVITANHGAMAEAVEDGVTGLLFEAGDAASLAAVLRRLVDDRGLRARLALAAAGRVRGEEEAARQLLDLYDRLRAPGRAGERA